MVRPFLTRSAVAPARDHQIVYLQPRQPIVVSGASLLPFASRNALMQLVALPSFGSADQLAPRGGSVGAKVVVAKRPLLINVNPGIVCPTKSLVVGNDSGPPVRLERR